MRIHKKISKKEQTTRLQRVYGANSGLQDHDDSFVQFNNKYYVHLTNVTFIIRKCLIKESLLETTY